MGIVDWIMSDSIEAPVAFGLEPDVAIIHPFLVADRWKHSSNRICESCHVHVLLYLGWRFDHFSPDRDPSIHWIRENKESLHEPTSMVIVNTAPPHRDFMRCVFSQP